MVFRCQATVIVQVHQEQVSAKVSIFKLLSEIILYVLRDGIQMLVPEHQEHEQVSTKMSVLYII